MRLIPLLALAVLLTSCAKEKEADKTRPEAPAPSAAIQAAPTNTFTVNQGEMQNPTNVVASVDGETLTWGDMRTEANLRLASMTGAPQTPQMMAQMQKIVVDQFTTRTLILNEAKRRNLSVSDEDLKKELAEIQKMIPPEVTVDDMLDKSPLGREAMLQHIKNKILIEKVRNQLAKDKIKLSKEEIDKFIEDNKDDLTLPERVEARHILILFEPKDDDKTKAEKKAKLEKIRQEIIDGADFAEMAKKYSQDGSAADGGYLGTFDRSKMVPEFGDAAFSQKVGEVGKVIETQFGYHIIKVEKHEKEGLYPRKDIEAKMRDLKMQSIMMKFIEELRAKADIKTFMN